jgi:hypothetical protein
MKILVTKFNFSFTIVMVLLFSAVTSTYARTSNHINGIAKLRSPLAANLLNINLLKNTSTGYGKADGITLIVNTTLASNGSGSNKLLNGADNIAFVEGSKVLANDGYKAVTPSDTISISISDLTPGTAYQLQVLSAKFKVSGITPMLFDKVTKTVTQFSSDTTLLNFTPTSADSSTYRSRYKIVFASSLPVREIKASAESKSNGLVSINWNTFSEINVVSYTIEKSNNGKEYSLLTTVNAKNANSASYSYQDANSLKQAYYRIKALNVDGSFSFSNVVYVTTKASVTGIYPNPVVGKTLHLATSNLADGKYAVTIYSTLGAKVFTTTIDGKSSVYDLNLSKLAAGNYSLVVASESAIIYNSNVQIK